MFSELQRKIFFLIFLATKCSILKEVSTLSKENEKELETFLIDQLKINVKEKNPEMVAAITRFFEVYFGDI